MAEALRTKARTGGKQVLVLYADQGTMRPTIHRHLEVLKHSPRQHHLRYVNVLHGVPAELHGHDCHDVVVLHSTFLHLRSSTIFHQRVRALAWLRDDPCLKIALPQNEYELSEILDELLYFLRVPVICSNFDERCRRSLYPIMHDKAHFVKAFAGYVDRTMAEAVAGRLPTTAERPIDVAYRAVCSPYQRGSHGQFKQRFGTIVPPRAEALGLRCDISTRPEDTIATDDWIRFLASTKTILGLVSGATALDHRGQLAYSASEALKRAPDLSFEEFSARMPAGWDDYRFFSLGARHFEAIYTKTVQVLIEGDFDAVLVAGRHYLPLKPDFSNLDDVLEQIKAPAHLQQIADTAYREIYLDGKYDDTRFCQRIDEIIEQHARSPSFAWRAKALVGRSATSAGNWTRKTMSNVLSGETIRRLLTTASSAAAAAPTARFTRVNNLLGLDLPSTCQGRLTVTRGEPVPCDNGGGATVLFFTPHLGDRVALFTSAQWRLFAFAEIHVSLDTICAGVNYDVFLDHECESMQPRLGLVAWRNDSERAVPLIYQDGIPLHAADRGRRYLGTVRGSAAGQVVDAPDKRFVWNQYNQVAKNLFAGDLSCHEFAAPSYDQPRRWHDDDRLQLGFVLGTAQHVAVECEAFLKSNEANEPAMVFPILDGRLALEPELGRYAGNYATQFLNVTTAGGKVLPAGYHRLGVAEQSGPRGGTFANCWLRGALLC